MARADLKRWNTKYALGNPNPEFTPDSILTRHADLLHGNGLALDVACGVGHNALYLARRGYDVLAVDGSRTGLDYCREQLRRERLPVQLVVADLDRFTPPANSFTLVLVVRYLNRVLIPLLKRTLVPGGLMIYQTFNRHRLLTNPGFNPDYLLEPGELAALFADFEPIASNDTPTLREPISFWIGRRPPEKPP